VKNRYFICILFILPTLLYATGLLVGEVCDRSNGEPLVGVNITSPELDIGAATDKNGRFVVTGIPAGTHTFEFSMIGYKTEVRKVLTEDGKTKTVKIFLKPERISMPEIIVTPGHYGISRAVDKPEQVLAVQEIKTTPGTQGDMFMALSTMPAVAAQGPAAPIYVQGGRSEENLVLLDQGWVASAFHMELGGGGVYSIFNPAILREVNLYTGGFGAEYGDRLSAVLDVDTRDGDYNRLHSSTALSNTFAEEVLEGPLPGTKGKGSFLISARRSFFDLIISFTEFSEDFKVFPNYYDLAGKLSYRISANQKLSLTGLWASDNAILKLSNFEVNVGEDEDWYSDKALLSLGLNSLVGTNFVSQFTLSASRGRYSFLLGDYWFDKQEKIVLATREDIIWNISSAQKLKTGFVLDRRFNSIDMKMPKLTNPQEHLRPDLPVSQLDTSLGSPFIGVYLIDDWRLLNPLTIELGLRSDYSFEFKEQTISPRLAAAWQIRENLILRTGWGIYHQVPPLMELSEEYGNPDLLSRRAQHYVAGIESELPARLTLRMEGFYKKFDRLPIDDSVLGFNNNGKGYAYGSGLLVQRRLAEKLNGWFSYSYTIARRSEYDYTDTISPDFDLPHRINLVATYDLSPTWQLGIKWIFSTGRPYTPIDSVNFDPISKSYIPIFGKPNSDRFPPYHQLDIRLLKEWRFSSWTLVTFLEVLNAYNRQNVADYQWNDDYTERTVQTYLPLIPSIGIIAKF